LSLSRLAITLSTASRSRLDQGGEDENPEALIMSDASDFPLGSVGNMTSFSSLPYLSQFIWWQYNEVHHGIISVTFLIAYLPTWGPLSDHRLVLCALR